MARPRDTLPPGSEIELERLVALKRELDRITEERDRLLLEITSRYGATATARGLGISVDVMHKRVARIRRTLGAVQHREAA